MAISTPSNSEVQTEGQKPSQPSSHPRLARHLSGQRGSVSSALVLALGMGIPTVALVEDCNASAPVVIVDKKGSSASVWREPDTHITNEFALSNATNDFGVANFRICYILGTEPTADNQQKASRIGENTILVSMGGAPGSQCNEVNEFDNTFMYVTTNFEYRPDLSQSDKMVFCSDLEDPNVEDGQYEYPFPVEEESCIRVEMETTHGNTAGNELTLLAPFISDPDGYEFVDAYLGSPLLLSPEILSDAYSGIVAVSPHSDIDATKTTVTGKNLNHIAGQSPDQPFGNGGDLVNFNAYNGNLTEKKKANPSVTYQITVDGVQEIDCNQEILDPVIQFSYCPQDNKVCDTLNGTAPLATIVDGIAIGETFYTLVDGQCIIEGEVEAESPMDIGATKVSHEGQVYIGELFKDTAFTDHPFVIEATELTMTYNLNSKNYTEEVASPVQGSISWQP